jgi:hypothetical protein
MYGGIRMDEKKLEAQVLKALDLAAADIHFPVLDNLNADYLAHRLTLHSDGSQWAIVFNSITFSNGSGLSAEVNPIGNCVKMNTWMSYVGQHDGEINNAQQSLELAAHPLDPSSALEEWLSQAAANPSAANSPESMGKLVTGFQKENPRFSVANFMAEMQKGNQMMRALSDSYHNNIASQGVSENDKYITTSDFEYPETDGKLDFDNPPLPTAIMIRGHRVPVAQLAVREDIELHPAPEFWISVASLEQYRDELFATDAEIAKFFPDGLPPAILMLEEWNHPDVTGDEKPSDSETFKMLANVIATCDVTCYKPSEKPNTQWQNWLPK